MGRLLILLILTLLAHIFTTTVVISSSSDKLIPWPPVKYTKLYIFLHGNLIPPNVTQVVVVKPEIDDLPYNFGQVVVIDEPLTIGPSASSPKLGSCQGMFIYCDKNAHQVLMSLSLVFFDGLYSGSTLVLLGRYHFELSPELSTGGDLPVVGGTGHFSYAQGLCNIQYKNIYDISVDVVDCDVYHRPLFTSNI